MRIFTNGMWCDTKFDWGYKTDEEFIFHLLKERDNLKIENDNLKKDLLTWQKIAKSLVEANEMQI